MFRECCRQSDLISKCAPANIWNRCPDAITVWLALSFPKARDRRIQGDQRFVLFKAQAVMLRRRELDGLTESLRSGKNETAAHCPST